MLQRPDMVAFGPIWQCAPTGHLMLDNRGRIEDCILADDRLRTNVTEIADKTTGFYGRTMPKCAVRDE